MNNNRHTSRPLQGLLLTLVGCSIAIAVAAYAYFGIIKPAFAKVNAAFEQVDKATAGAR